MPTVARTDRMMTTMNPRFSPGFWKMEELVSRGWRGVGDMVDVAWRGCCENTWVG